MIMSDALRYHQDVHARSRIYCAQPIDPDYAALTLKPLVAQTYAADNYQLAAHFALPKAQIAATVKGGRNPNYATWNLGQSPYL